ncbi:MAG: hypothetical protein LWX70_13955, partial [Sphingobacteriia bacterium]|nr:hypothetical protein [Sphingobacteriia bacterium]
MVVVLVLNGISRCAEGDAVVYHPNRDRGCFVGIDVVCLFMAKQSIGYFIVDIAPRPKPVGETT